MGKIEENKCPFCGAMVKHTEIGNGFCSCGAKYYSEDRVWLNRKTGEEVKGKE